MSCWIKVLFLTEAKHLKGNCPPSENYIGLLTQNNNFRLLGSFFLPLHGLMSVFWTWPSRKSPTKRQGLREANTPSNLPNTLHSPAAHMLTNTYTHTHFYLISLALNMLHWELSLALLVTGFSAWALPSTNIKITQGECHQNQRQGCNADTDNML